MIPADIETTTQWRVTHANPVPGGPAVTRIGTEAQVRAIAERMEARGLAPLVESRAITVGCWGKPVEVKSDE